MTHLFPPIPGETPPLDPRLKLPVIDPTPEVFMDFRAQGGLPDLAMFGVNFTGKCYEDWRWHNSNGYFAILTKYHHPAWLNLTGAEQYAQARQRAAECRTNLPHTGILWRHMKHTPPGASENTDKGMWKLPPREYVDNTVLAHGTGSYYNVTDCEGHIDRHEVKTYAAMQAEVLDYGTQPPNNARFAVLRMSTHNPLPDVLDSGDLDELLKAIGRNMGSWDDPRVVISNNGYFDDSTNEDGLLTARRIEQRCISKFGFRPVIVMGEYGFDRGFTSENGWRVSQMNGAQMVGKLIDHAKHIPGMAACVYGVGFNPAAKVNTFHLDNPELELLMKLSPVYVPPGPIVIPPVDEEPPVVIPPPVEIAWIEATLEAGTQPNGEPGSIFVRPQPGAAEWVAIPKDGDDIFYKPEPVKTSSKNGVSYKWLYVRTKDHVEGWMALVMPGETPEKPGAQFVPKVVTPPVEEPNEPEPDPDVPNDAPATIHDVDKLRAETIAYIDLQCAALVSALNKVRAEKDTLAARVDVYERIMRAHHLSIENELKLAG